MEQINNNLKGNNNEVVEKIKYCLYARKSTESQERQILSIDSQIKEMLQLAERENLEIVTIKRESHSAKETGQRPIFNEVIDRKSVVQGKSVDLGGRRIIKKKKTKR